MKAKIEVKYRCIWCNGALRERDRVKKVCSNCQRNIYWKQQYNLLKEKFEKYKGGCIDEIRNF